jgi:carbon monoxide dehydrogenase subunit G
MELEHTFTVPVGVEQAWAEFQDIASVALCFPGATVSGVEGDTFTGSVKVKLGPIALVYNGSGTFTEKDDAAHRFVVDAKGKDKRGNGTAGATVTLTMTEATAGAGDSTDIRVHTDLAITGKPAQFGRGVMQDVSDKLLGQFVACLEQRLGDEDAAASPAAEPPAEQSTESPGAAGPAAPTPPPAPVGPVTAADEPTVTDAAPEVADAAPTPPATPAPAATPAAAPPATPSRARGSDDALDLGRTVLPVLVKSYWKPVLAAVVVIVVIIWLVTR